MTQSTNELLQQLNGYRILDGKQPLDKWKKSRSDLEALLQSYTEPPETEAEQEERLMEALGPVPELVSDHVEASDEAQDEVAAEILPALNETTELPKLKSPRGAIGIMVMDLLQTDMPYKDIVAKVRETYWDAKTTERSIASVAMDLRRDGVTVPPRRKPAAIKPPKATAPVAQVEAPTEEPNH